MQNTTIENIEQQVRAVIISLPQMIGTEVVNFALQNFANQGFNGNHFQSWPTRKTVTKKNKGRAILVQSGRLKRSIRITRYITDGVAVGSDTPYAKVHNEGFRGTVQVKAFQRNKYESKKVETGKLTKKGNMRMKTVQSIAGTIPVKAHTMRMNIPKREFLGNSPYLEARITRLIAAQLMKISNN